MKRIQSACICQTLHFLAKEDVEPTFAARKIHEEVSAYKQGLVRSHTQHKILEETTQSDGSVILKLIKQYNQSPVGDYLA